MAKNSAKKSKRADPYKGFRFRLRSDGKVVLGASKVSALKRTTQVIKYRDGGDNGVEQKLSGPSTYDAITFERGVTYDLEFGKWASKFASDGDAAKLKKELALETVNEKGRVVSRYLLHAAWVSEIAVHPSLDARANALPIESLKVEVEGWDRDADDE